MTNSTNDENGDQKRKDDILTPAQRYVRNHRDDLMYLLKHGDRTTRALALTVLMEGGHEADIELIERELELAKKLDDDEYSWRE